MSQSPYEQQPDNESNPRNSSSEQVYQNQQPAQPAYQQQPTYQQPMYAQPMMAVVPKTPQQIAGEQAAQTSLALGIVGLVLALFWVTSVIPLGLGIWGAVKGAQASRAGVPAGGGLATSWIALSLGAVETLFFFIPMVAFVIAAIASTR